MPTFSELPNSIQDAFRCLGVCLCLQFVNIAASMVVVLWTTPIQHPYFVTYIGYYLGCFAALFAFYYGFYYFICRGSVYARSILFTLSLLAILHFLYHSYYENRFSLIYVSLLEASLFYYMCFMMGLQLIGSAMLYNPDAEVLFAKKP